ncbi:hypothetical protein AG1IA_05308 [Rhizoctonia solani AG-1 IA]|uniref:Uncharacterized protein n=1 Tax=Thanatephorus cucumeris (strain AG1-IA) TaxID=983506 RepID=L8WWC8_THACA|nr:hypothetical protein AG1IA_05308 [Rhizoctonia solani AG-1 IA]
MALSQESSHHRSSSNITSIRTNSDLPPFRSFPAAQDGCLSNPATGRRPSPKGSDINYGTQRHQATDNGSIHNLIHSSSACGERQRVACLPEFTPFPSAPPSHRYAPPEGLRAVQPQPIPLPEYAIQTNVSCPPVSPLDAIQYPRQVLKSQKEGGHVDLMIFIVRFCPFGHAIRAYPRPY